jgi:hypothetical protein
MPDCLPSPSLLAVTESVQHRISSGLIDGFSQWWQMPALVAALAAIVAFVFWMYRRDAVELPRGVGAVLALMRVGALAALAAAYLDFERVSEHEIVFPSRVAVLVDSSASMTLEDDQPAAVPATGGASAPAAAITRSQRALDALDGGGLLTALAARHEVSIWRFDADAEPLAVLPVVDGDGAKEPPADGPAAAPQPAADWRSRTTPRGFETRIGESLARVLDQEPAGVLAGVIVLTDGANNAGVDPAAAVASLVKADVPVHPLGIGSDRLPTNVRVADLLVPSRVFPGDRFAVTGYLQAQGLAGQTVKVELIEADPDAVAGPSDQPAVAGRPAGRLIDAAEVALAANGELSPVRFDVPGLESPGRRNLVLRVVAPAGDRTPSDDGQAAEIEVVDQVTQVLLMAGGPSREYQFMRNVLERDKSFAVDVLLGTAVPGVSQDARRILGAFPASAEELAEYDVVVAFDYDWRRLDQAAQARLERWVSQESGGLVLVAGSIFMDAWLADPQTATLRNLHPVELRRSSQLIADEPAGFEEPMPLDFSRDGQEAEFLWLGSSRIASQTVWAEFPGVFSCFDTGVAKPGATVYARVARPGARPTSSAQPIYMAGQFYGSGNVFFLGSGETWRLRSLDDSLFERLTTQLVRHVSQGRLLRGSRRARVLVDRDRFAVGSNVVVRVVAAEGGAAAGSPRCEVVGPDGATVRVPLEADRSRPGVLQGAFVASREGTWRIDLELSAGGETISRRVQARLPDRELARPRLERGLLEQLATLTGGRPHFLSERGWTGEDSRKLAASIPDRSRREYEAGAADVGFKRRLNAILLAVGASLLCLEWIVRRLVKLA